MYGLKKKSVSMMKRTLGEPQTPKRGFGFPQRLREKDKRRERRRRTYQTAKERESGHKHQSKQGAGLEGHKTRQHFNPKDQETRTTNQLNTQEHLDKKQSPSERSLRGMITAGWLGPWAALRFLRRHPGGPWYRGVRKPPHHGNRPRWRKNRQHAKQEAFTPERNRPSSSPVPMSCILSDTVQQWGTQPSKNHPNRNSQPS